MRLARFGMVAGHAPTAAKEELAGRCHAPFFRHTRSGFTAMRAQESPKRAGW